MKTEPQGAITFHVRSQECYTSFQNSRGWPSEAIAPTAADTPMSAERLRVALSSSAKPANDIAVKSAVRQRGNVAAEGPEEYRATTAGKQKRKGQSLLGSPSAAGNATGPRGRSRGRDVLQI
jgi:hypothetical protein